jgi:hypothetical protein
MSRSKIKSKVVRSTIANKDVIDLFHGVLGTSEGSVHLSIAHPKYEMIRKQTDRFLRLLEALRDSSVMKKFPDENGRLAKYITTQRDQYDDSFCAPELAPYIASSGTAEAAAIPVAAAAAQSAKHPPSDPYSMVPPDMAARFLEIFAVVKKCSVVNTAIVTCKNLIPHKRYIRDQNDLKDKFLKGAGLTVSPIEGLALNVKQLYISDLLSAIDRKFILTVLHKMWTISHDVYEAVSSPDIDVNEFVMVIMSSIGEVRRHIPRCNEAFDKIIQSVDLLKGNFDGYYRDYVASSNPTIIMENFVIDVSKSTKSNPTVTAQFRKIIAHYRKLASQQASHPKLQSLFKQVDKNFQELEKQNRAADTIDSESGSDSDDSDEDPDVARHEAEEVAALEAAAGIGPLPAKKDPPGADEPVHQMSKAKRKRMRQKLKAKQAMTLQNETVVVPAAIDEETVIDAEDAIESVPVAGDVVGSLGSCEEEESATEEAADGDACHDDSSEDADAKQDAHDQPTDVEQDEQERALNDHLGPEPEESSAAWRGSQIASLLSSFGMAGGDEEEANEDASLAAEPHQTLVNRDRE